jgi:hypothetical protein
VLHSGGSKKCCYVELRKGRYLEKEMGKDRKKVLFNGTNPNPAASIYKKDGMG